ncbi:Hypothetical protein FKW44_018782 [Caligus rogercresseyi]|uniref:Uncharacterized protein n=1 Tax=Caligus rogercresseyi TaxID=217165 RepID=A0A7T8JX21_CALRO|nr:Hypothetical protein FKW44_018782 [Caligus rogercresseyi]
MKGKRSAKKYFFSIVDVKDGTTSTSGNSLREQAFPPSPRWPPRRWPWRPRNAYTPTIGAEVPGIRLVISSSPSRGGP